MLFLVALPQLSHACILSWGLGWAEGSKNASFTLFLPMAFLSFSVHVVAQIFL